MKTFNNITDATNYVNARCLGEEVYGLNNLYVAMLAEEADELVAAGVSLTIGSPDEEDTYDVDESMDGDHESALASVYGDNSGDFDDIDSYGDDCGGFFD